MVKLNFVNSYGHFSYQLSVISYQLSAIITLGKNPLFQLSVISYQLSAFSYQLSQDLRKGTMCRVQKLDRYSFQSYICRLCVSPVISYYSSGKNTLTKS
ncbi:MAG: hypothetical protein F6K17_06290 [Okeania sp. SIO3C4]|nr:hypothetical protein [Okeania sp. SIO3C4]